MDMRLVIRLCLALVLCSIVIGCLVNGHFGTAIIALAVGLLLIIPVARGIFRSKSMAESTNGQNSTQSNEPIKQSVLVNTDDGYSGQQSADLITISNAARDNKISFTIDLNEAELIKRIENGTLAMNKRDQETSIYDIAGFYGSVSYSGNEKYCLVFRDGYVRDERWKNGDIALLKDKTLLFKKKLERPHDCYVSDNGIVVCCDWLNSEGLTGMFLIYDEYGNELFKKKNMANLGTCSISNSGDIALFETHNSDTSDGDKITLIDVLARKIIRRFERPASFNSAVIDTNTERIKLIDHRRFVFEIDFEGHQTNTLEYEDQIMEKGSIYDRLCLYTDKPDKIKFKEVGYLSLLIGSLEDENALYAFGKDRIYRMIGEYHEDNGNISGTIENWEKALELNPKVGIKRRLDALKKRRG